MSEAIIQEEVRQVPGHPTVNERDQIFDQEYILHFSSGNKVDFKVFKHVGTFSQALERGRRHCRLVGVRFLFIRPFITDLDAQERKHLRIANESQIPESV